MFYRDYPHRRPTIGAELPAFIVSEYEGGDVLLYSHGGFDVWCVYHAVSLQGTDGPGSGKRATPLRLDKIRVEKSMGGATSFQGSFFEYAVVPFSFSAPEDVDYLQDIRELAEKYGKERVWDSFLELYESIPQERGVSISKEMTEISSRISDEYPGEPKAHLMFDCLLCAMIAENNRLRKYGSTFDTKLGKKVKALGVYQAIFEEELSIRQVADYSKGKKWRWIEQECLKRGIRTEHF